MVHDVCLNSSSLKQIVAIYSHHAPLVLPLTKTVVYCINYTVVHINRIIVHINHIILHINHTIVQLKHAWWVAQTRFEQELTNTAIESVLS